MPSPEAKAGPTHPAFRAAWAGPLVRRLLLASDPGFAAIQSVVLQLLTVGANLATGVITARLLGAEGRGVYAAAISWPTMLGSVAIAGIVEAVLMEIRRHPQRTLCVVAWGGTAALACASLVTAVTYAALPALLGPHHREAVDVARAALLLTHAIASGVLWRYVFSGRGEFLLANVAGFLPPLLHAVAICALALAGRLTVATAIAGLGFGVVGAQVLLLPFLLRELHGQEPMKTARPSGLGVLNFAVRAAPADLLAICCDWADRLLLIFLLPPEALGIYVVAYGFSRVVAVVTPTNGLLLSAMTRTDLAEAKQLHDLSLRGCVVALSIGTIAAWIAGDFFIGLFYGQAFLSAGAIFKVLVLQAAAARLAGVTSQLYLAYDRPGLNSAFAFVNVVVSILLIVLLTPAHGALGAAWGLLAGTLARLGLLLAGMPLHLRLTAPRLWPSLADVEAARVMFRP